MCLCVLHYIQFSHPKYIRQLSCHLSPLSYFTFHLNFFYILTQFPVYDPFPPVLPLLSLITLPSLICLSAIIGKTLQAACPFPAFFNVVNWAEDRSEGRREGKGVGEGKRGWGRGERKVVLATLRVQTREREIKKRDKEI